MIYICLLAGALILGLLLCRNKKGSMIYCIIMGIAMFLVAALRRSVGTDYNNYAHMYMRAMTSDIEEMVFDRTEKGYTMLTKLLADHFSDYQAIFIVCAAFFAVCVAVAAYKYCKRPYLGICFFLAFGLYFNTLNFLRQEIAGFIIMLPLLGVTDNSVLFHYEDKDKTRDSRNLRGDHSFGSYFLMGHNGFYYRLCLSVISAAHKCSYVKRHHSDLFYSNSDNIGYTFYSQKKARREKPLQRCSDKLYVLLAVF